MVVISDINEKARGKVRDLYESNEVQTRMRSLEYYLTTARQIISRFATGSVRTAMLNDEDAIAFVAEHLMTGTVRFDESKRTWKSYLNQCGMWAIKRWLNNLKVAGKYDVQSLDFSASSDGESQRNTLHNLIPDKNPGVVESIIANETLDEILNHECLNDAQKKCLKMKFVDNMTYQEISETINVSRQRVEQITKEALKRLHANLEV